MAVRRAPAVRLLAVLLALGAGTTRAAAQEAGSPLTFGRGHVVVSGDLAASAAPDDLGFFNYSDYEHSALREVRLGVSTEVRAGRRLALLAEVRTGNLEGLTPYSLFARIRPWRRVQLQVGRIPPTFGAYTRRVYSRENPLIGYPIAYQYLISLRPDAVPVSGDELVRMRGRGWLSAFTRGVPTLDRGVPLVTVFSRDTGAQVSGQFGMVELSTAVTAGSPANPRLHDGNSGLGISHRAAVTPRAGLTVGASYAGGTFLRNSVGTLGRLPGRDIQRVGGLDLEASGGPWVARADLVVSQWWMPVIARPELTAPLKATAGTLEVRRTLMPGLYVAGRVERLLFNTVRTNTGRQTWEAPVTRVETGIGYSLRRNMQLRGSVQVNRRDGGRVTRSVLPSVQVLAWF